MVLTLKASHQSLSMSYAVDRLHLPYLRTSFVLCLPRRVFGSSDRQMVSVLSSDPRTLEAVGHLSSVSLAYLSLRLPWVGGPFYIVLVNHSQVVGAEHTLFDITIRLPYPDRMTPSLTHKLMQKLHDSMSRDKHTSSGVGTATSNVTRSLGGLQMSAACSGTLTAMEGKLLR